MDFIVYKIIVEMKKPEDPIVKQGEEVKANDGFYIIGKGECEVRVQDENKKEKLERVLHPGQHFGEVAFINNVKRTATV
jgi:CRP-like cAMP-binding protein